MTRTLLLFACLVCCLSAVAAEQPIVRAELSTQRIAIGESVALKITVLVPTWFSRPLVYPHLELANTITRLPDDSSYPIRERVGDQSWSGIVRSYEILPLLAANYTFSGRKISIEYANPGSDPVSVEMDIPTVSFRAAAPAGSESLDPYIAGADLALKLSVLGDASELAAGDALVIQYSAELDGLPAIFLPPLAPEMAFEGVSVYADTPVVDDRDSARRTEKLTLVFDGGGQFTVPAVVLDYWNTATQSIATVKSEELTISVTGPPAITATVLEPERSRALPVAIGVLVLAVFAWAFYVWGPAFKNALRERREARRQSEPAAFARVQAALQANRERESYELILDWLERLREGFSVRAFARAFGDDTLMAEMNALSGRLYGDSAEAVDCATLASCLHRARAHYLRKETQSHSAALPPLNP